VAEDAGEARRGTSLHLERGPGEVHVAKRHGVSDALDQVTHRRVDQATRRRRCIDRRIDCGGEQR
jgi:hypothetical protein